MHLWPDRKGICHPLESKMCPRGLKTVDRT